MAEAAIRIHMQVDSARDRLCSLIREHPERALECLTSLLRMCAASFGSQGVTVSDRADAEMVGVVVAMVSGKCADEHDPVYMERLIEGLSRDYDENSREE